MPALDVQWSESINSVPNVIMSKLTDFATWPAWSPWLFAEPDAVINYHGTPGVVGHKYDWRGEKVGQGSMQLLSSDEQSMHCELKFLKPFKSTADVQFNLDAGADGATSVSWSMKSSLPFFMFFFKGMMTGMIRSDYRRGLLMLKDYIEIGAVPSSAIVEGTVDIEPFRYIGHTGEAAMGELSAGMETGFAAVGRVMHESSLEVTGFPHCFYNHMDIKQGRCKFTVALPTNGKVTLEPPLQAGQQTGCKALKLVHTGAYRHLGNAWAMIMGEARARKLKAHKAMVPFERYVNDPDDTDEKDLITEVYLPLR